MFLRRRGDGQYEGEPPYCRLPVHVVAEDGQYALRWPIEGVRPPPLAGRELVFADRAAYLDPARLTSEEIADLSARWPTVALPDGRLRFARGIPLAELRPQLFPEGLPPRQAEDRPAPRERE
ncbi:MAG: hypothetical protein RML12_04725 [Xanthomonadales bacterium]|nr:hypothetical protein [Xanthomonadales bacterium]